MKIYLVIWTFEYEWRIESDWTTPEAAELERARISGENPMDTYEVEEMEVRT